MEVTPSKTVIAVGGQFEAFHCWAECPFPDVAFLRNPHRHIFHVKLKLKVSHDDRDLEFIQMKRILENYLKETYHCSDLGSKSCEMVAKEIADYFFLYVSKVVDFVSVYEDNENGAEVYYG